MPQNIAALDALFQNEAATAEALASQQQAQLGQRSFLAREQAAIGRLRASGAVAPAPTIAPPISLPNATAQIPQGLQSVLGRAAAAGSAAAARTVSAAPQIRAPSGGGLAAIAIFSALPSELPRLGSLIANPQQYWREEMARQRAANPDLYDLFNPVSNAQPGIRGGSLRPAIGILPFTGGQTPDRLYDVSFGYSGTFKTQYYGDRVFDGSDPIKVRLQVRGRITGYQNTKTSNSSTVYVYGDYPSSYSPGFTTNPFTENNVEIVGFSCAPADGQPDSGGNPAAVVDPSAPPRPALAPARSFYVPPAPSRSPTAVPFNSPHRATEPAAGQRTLAAQNPALTPRYTIAPTINPDQQRRVAPDAFPGVPDAIPSPATRSPNPALLPLAAGIAAIGAIGGLLTFGGSRTTRITTPSPSPTPETGTGTGTGIGTGSTPGLCRFRDDPYSAGIDARTSEIKGLELAIQGYQTAMLSKLDAKLGTQLPGGGIAGKLGRMGALASKTWNFLQVDRALAVFTWIGVLHNAYMLSNQLGQTLFSAIGNVLDAVGIQKVDAEGNEEPYDVSEIVTKYTDNFAKQVFGVEEWKGIKKEWKAFNRIYQAATNIVNSLQSITFSMVEMLETIANHTGRIGNALRKSGTILQNSFNWMNPNANFTNNRFFNALNNTNEAVEVVDQIASEVLSIQQTAKELADQKNEAEKATTEALKLINNAETKSTAVSVKPGIAINPTDEKKAQTP